jgi:hypothetical protein
VNALSIASHVGLGLTLQGSLVSVPRLPPSNRSNCASEQTIKREKYSATPCCFTEAQFCRSALPPAYCSWLSLPPSCTARRFALLRDFSDFPILLIPSHFAFFQPRSSLTFASACRCRCRSSRAPQSTRSRREGAHALCSSRGGPRGWNRGSGRRPACVRPGWSRRKNIFRRRRRPGSRRV